MQPDRHPDRHLDYPFGDTLPAPGKTIELLPGVRWLRMRLPFALDHINLWLLRDRQHGVEGWTIVDCGIADDATRADWEAIFAHELDGLPVLRVIVTHMHPDHIGLADWLCRRWSGSTAGGEAEPDAGPPQGGPSPLGGQRSGAAASVGVCRLHISATDWYAARNAIRTATGFNGEAAAAFFGRHGLADPESLEKVRSRGNHYARMVPSVPEQFHRLMDGMRLEIGGRTWRCIVGHGHAPEHMALHCPALDVLISGDMVLPRISTNVSVVDIEPDADPLPLYLASIDRMRRDLPASTLVLPSHGKPFRGLHTRVAQLQAHHDDRYADVMAACRVAPQSAADLLPVLFQRKLDLHQTTFAMGESIAHLHALAGRGALVSNEGADGVLRFSVAA